MKFFYNCFDKNICLELYSKPSDLLFFWLKRFCPNIKEIPYNKKNIIVDYDIKFIKSEEYDYIEKENSITILGVIAENESFIAKFVTQCFQKLLIEDNILIVPSSCVCYRGQSLLIIGDFWQGKTSVALNLVSNANFQLISDNYVAIKNGNIIGCTNYISIRKEDIGDRYTSIYTVNDRYFYENEYCFNNENLQIIGFLLPYINNSDNNIHFISTEECKWYLYQKFTRLFCGEAILFEGKLPSPIFLNKDISKKVLNIINELLKNNRIKYVSSSMSVIIEEGQKMLCKGEIVNE